MTNTAKMRPRATSPHTRLVPVAARACRLRTAAQWTPWQVINAAEPDRDAQPQDAMPHEADADDPQEMPQQGMPNPCRRRRKDVSLAGAACTGRSPGARGPVVA